MNVAVILAGGVGQRMCEVLPKQFVNFAGETCLERSISRFISNKNIDQVIAVVHKDWETFARKLLEKNNYACTLISAGNNRSQSSYNALKFIKSCDKILIHDAVRPFIKPGFIDMSLSVLDEYDAVTLAVPVKDTISEAENGLIKNIPDRSKFFVNQTPQAFRFQVIKEAYDMAYGKDPELKGFSDDCGVLKKYFPEKQIKIIPGDYQNMKLTVPMDLFLFEKLASEQEI